jgi:hypothetical protein
VVGGVRSARATQAANDKKVLDPMSHLPASRKTPGYFLVVTAM